MLCWNIRPKPPLISHPRAQVCVCVLVALFVRFCSRFLLLRLCVCVCVRSLFAYLLDAICDALLSITGGIVSVIHLVSGLLLLLDYGIFWCFLFE